MGDLQAKRRLLVLLRRADWLHNRMSERLPREDHRLAAELSAILWVVKLVYEVKNHRQYGRISV